MIISKINSYNFSDSTAFKKNVGKSPCGINVPYSKYGYRSSNMPFNELSSDIFECYAGPHAKKNKKVLNFSLSESVNECLAEYSPETFMNKYLSYDVIKKAVNKNPNITRILAKKGLSPVIYMENIQGSKQKHFIDTYKYAKKIAELNNFNKEDKSILMQAALLHDIGKVFIPREILDKPGRLTPGEREIVDLHAQLGYEILKTTDLNSNIEEAVRLHHTPISQPVKKDNVLAQVLSVADVYSALTEPRSYKEAMNDKMASRIMKDNSNLSQSYVSDIFGRRFKQ